MSAIDYSELSSNDVLTLRSVEVLLKEVPDKELDELLQLDRNYMLAQIEFLGLSSENPVVSAPLTPVTFLQSLPREFKQQAIVLQRKSLLQLKQMCLQSILIAKKDAMAECLESAWLAAELGEMA